MEKFYKILEINNQSYVVCDKERRQDGLIPESNFAGSGLALCGTLLKDETLDEWIIRKNKQIEKTKKLTMRGKRFIDGKKWDKYVES